MALIVNTNIQAMNAQRNLEKTGLAFNKALERLSSGQRINNASDDAAGLAISTRLGAQVRGLNQAIRNANDGAAMLQTAEGALSEITNIVTRVKELAVQSANGSNSSTDRTSINAEVQSLISEVTRIATQTKFGSTALLDGSFNGSFQVGTEVAQTVSQAVGNFKASALSGDVATQTLAFGAGLASSGATNASTYLGVDSSTDFQVTGPKGAGFVRQTVAADDGVSHIENSQSAIAFAKVVNELTSTTGVSATVGAAIFEVADNAERFDDIDLTQTANAVYVNGQRISVDLNGGGQAVNRQLFIDAVNSQVAGVVASAGDGNGGLVLTAADGRNISLQTAAGTADGTAAEELFGFGTAPTTEGVVARGSVSLMAGGTFTTVPVAGDAATITGEGTANATSASLSSLSVDTVANANTAMLVADSLLDYISGARGDLGAVQNRLASTVANLGVVAEKVSEARSRIMDADFAAETASMTKAQILQQAGISILSQANSAPQSALTLLRG